MGTLSEHASGLSEVVASRGWLLLGARSVFSLEWPYSRRGALHADRLCTIQHVMFVTLPYTNLTHVLVKLHTAFGQLDG